MSSQAETPVVMAAKMIMKDTGCVVSLAYVNHSTRTIGACEFADDDQFCAFEAAVVQIGAKECALPREAPTPENRRLRDVLSRCGALASEIKPSEFTTVDLNDDLKRLVKGGNVEHYRAVLERDGAAAAVKALLTFSEILSDRANHNKYVLVK